MPLRFRILPTDRAAPAAQAGPAGPHVARDLEVPDDIDEIRVGRRADVELPLPFAVLSGVHVRLSRVAGGWVVEDAGSTNGTWLDGAPLPPGERRPLVPGAELRLAGVRLRFEGAGGAAPAAEGTGTIARRLVDDLFAGGAHGAPALRIVSGAPPRTLTLAVAGRPYLAGRAETCALCLAVEEVSREHAAFARGADGVVVRDLGSKNGVVLRGVRVAGEVLLADGDLVQIGPVTLTLDDPVTRYLRELEQIPPDPPPAVSAAPPAAPPPPPSPPISEAVPSARPERGSTRVIVVVAAAVLLFLAVTAVVIFWPRG
jgi:pSer/pThr/pTyr-binding forkhead associated (FHA) protein